VTAEPGTTTDDPTATADRAAAADPTATDDPPTTADPTAAEHQAPGVVAASLRWEAAAAVADEVLAVPPGPDESRTANAAFVAATAVAVVAVAMLLVPVPSGWRTAVAIAVLVLGAVLGGGGLLRGRARRRMHPAARLHEDAITAALTSRERQAVRRAVNGRSHAPDDRASVVDAVALRRAEAGGTLYTAGAAITGMSGVVLQQDSSLLWAGAVVVWSAALATTWWRLRLADRYLRRRGLRS
jgi:hypothetical protein